MLSHRTLLYVVTTAKMGSFTKAAESLYVSQSSISQAIKSLEEELNTAIFVRHNNKIFLTKAGEIFVSEAEKILERSELLRKRIIELADGSRTTVTFGISSFYSKYYLPKMIPKLEKRLPRIKFSFTEDISYNLEKMVSDEILDFCMVPMPIAHNDLTAIELKKERIFLAVPKNSPVCERMSQYADLSEVKDEPFVFLKAFQRFTDMGLKLCKQYGFSPNIVYESMNWETIDALIGEGIGVGLVPDVVTNIGGLKKPVYYPIDSELAMRSYALVFKTTKHRGNELKSVIECVTALFEKNM